MSKELSLPISISLFLRRMTGFLASLAIFFAVSDVQAQYCTPQVWSACANPYDGVITNVTIGSTQNTSGCTGAYTFYGNVGHRALAGVNNTLAVTAQMFGAWTFSMGGVRAWIDYNNNNIFDANEVVMSLTGIAAPTTLTASFNPPVSAVGFRRLRIRADGPNNDNVDPCGQTYGETEDYTIEIVPPTPDPSPVAIVLASPGSSTSINPPVGAGTYDIGFILQNVSGGALASVTANYTITGPQNRSGSVNWSGNLPVGGTVYVPLASNLALSDPLQPYTVSINLTNSVGSQGPGDGNLANNSLTGFVAMALNGSADPLNPNIYYVSGAPVPGQWFANLTDVSAALTFGGILGAVEFRVRPGTYNEQMLIGQISQTVQGIPGSSPSRPVTFTADAAAGGNVNNVIVSSANTSLNNHTVQLNGADNITFRNMTFAINTASAVAGRNFWLRNGTDNVTVSNCRFQGRNAIIGGANDALIFSETTNAPINLTINNNTFTNGDIGIMIDGGVSGNPINNLVISNNTLNGFFTQGIYVQRATAPRITSNQVNGSTVNPSGAFGINLDRLVNDAVIARNRITMTTLGTGIRFNTNTATSALPASIANNMINVGNGISSIAMGISTVSATNTNVFHNTVNVNAPASATAAAFNISASLPAGLRVVNNIFYNRGLGYAYYIAVSGFPTQSDWNNLFTAGANLGWHTSANRADLAAFRSGTFELNSRSVPLVFTGVTSTFLTQPESQLRGTPAFNNTAVGNVSDDINTTARMTPPYMGAHELVPVVTFASGPIDSTCTGGDITLRSRPIIRSSIDGVQTTIYDAASGTPAPSWVSFRWSKGGAPLFDQPGKISGTRSMDLTIARTNFFDGDNYSMIATIKDGAALRDNPVDTLFYAYSVTVKVNEPVSISRHPMSQVVCRAGVVNLNVIASQGTIWGYQWYK
ncbi:MAG: GEVED domain-containing protein, partial [Candidatus Kapaibacterium sp.]